MSGGNRTDMMDHFFTMAGRSRNTAADPRLLDATDQAKPGGELYLITDNHSSHKSPPIQERPAARPRGRSCSSLWEPAGSICGNDGGGSLRTHIQGQSL